jgi:ParB-like chromosome segregation protein Spo0J
MIDLPPNIQARREIEDRAAKLGVRRRGYETALKRNNAEISDLLRDAEGTGASLEQLAALLGVSRQSLSKWRDEAIAQRPAQRSSPRRTGSP